MKKIIGALLGIGLLITLYSFLKTDSDQVFVQKVNPLQSGVFISSEGEERIASETQDVHTGDVIKTDTTGTALIEGGHATYIEPSTTLHIKELRSEGSIFGLELGGLWARTQKVLEQGEFYEIETHNARAAVRGTSFGVLLGGTSQSMFFVTEGSISLWQKNPETGEIIIESEVVVNAGEKAEVGEKGIIKSALTQKDDSGWFRKYNPDWKFEEVKKEVPKVSTPVSTKIVEEKPITPVSVEPGVIAPAPIEPVVITSSLILTSVVPAEVPFTQTSFVVTLNGVGFLKTKALIIGKQTISNFTIVSDSKIQFDIIKNNIPPGAYDVSVLDISNTVSTRSRALTILDRASSVDSGTPNR